MCGLALSVETTEFLHRLCRGRTTGLSSGGSLFVGVGGNARLRIYPCSRADSGWVRGEACWGWVPRVFSREPAASWVDFPVWLRAPPSPVWGVRFMRSTLSGGV